MGHYSDDYEYESNKRAWEQGLNRKKAHKKLEGILREYSHHADNQEMFSVKIKEAIFWLYGELPIDHDD